MLVVVFVAAFLVQTQDPVKNTHAAFQYSKDILDAAWQKGWDDAKKNVTHRRS